MKKTLPLFLTNVAVTLALVSTFGALGLRRPDQEAVERFTGVLETNVKLRILDNDTAKEKGYLTELLDAFNAAYASYGITAEDANIGSFTDLEKLGPAGYGPDVVYYANDVVMKYAENRHVQPLPVEDTELYAKIPQEAWSACESVVDGQKYTFAVPVNIQEPVLFYRKDLLPANWQTAWDKNQDGVPDMIQNWSDLYAFSAQIKLDSGGNKYGYMKSLNDQYCAAGYLISYGGYIFAQDEETQEYDTFDIGLSAGESFKGARMIRQLADVMDNNCASDAITKNAYEQLGSGTYFATMTTPDVYGTFFENFAKAWAKSHKSWTAQEVNDYVRENLGVVKIPALPKSADLKAGGETFEMTAMGGINGYAMSSYTKSPNAALAFIEFASRYDMVVRRAELLGIAPAMTDASDASNDTARAIYSDLVNGKIYLMPGERALSQVWESFGSFLRYIAEDGLKNGNAYDTDEKLIKGLKSLNQEIYDAIHTLG